jgi:hypothetical protein
VEGTGTAAGASFASPVRAADPLVHSIFPVFSVGAHWCPLFLKTVYSNWTTESRSFFGPLPPATVLVLFLLPIPMGTVTLTIQHGLDKGVSGVAWFLILEFV